MVQWIRQAPEALVGHAFKEMQHNDGGSLTLLSSDRWN